MTKEKEKKKKKKYWLCHFAKSWQLATLSYNLCFYPIKLSQDLVRINTDQKEKGMASFLLLYSLCKILLWEISTLSCLRTILKDATQSLVDVSPPI